tara:strand:+ start:972 stop:1166 length:195 start_codon:yes stop_codon:yes gene_type:complete
MIDFEYKEIVRVNNKVVGYIEKCRSGYFYRPKEGDRSKLYDRVDQVRSSIKKHYKEWRVKYNGM